MTAMYKLTVGVTFIPEMGFVRTYGIIGKQGDRTEHIEDISNDKQAVQHLVDLLNQHDVHLIHFRAIIEDWLVL